MRFTLVPDGCAHWDLRKPEWTWTPAPESIAVLTDDAGNAVSVCRLFSRKLNSFEMSLDAYGIGGVFTHPDHRGKGYARRLLNEVSQALWKGPATALVLQARNGLLYQRCGFTHIQRDLYAKALLPGMAFLEMDWRLDVQHWQVWPEGHF